MPYSISNFLYKRTLLPKALFADDVSGFRAGLRSTNTSDTWINDSDIFWSTPPRRWKPSGLRYKLIELFRPQLARRQLAVSFVLIMIGLACGFYSPFRIRYTYSESVIESSHSIRPVLPPFQRNEADPIRWIKENSNDKYAVPTSLLPSLQFNRPRAALISLVRNAELPGMIESIQQMERRWNEKYQYPWIFFNDEPFTEEFKAVTQNATSAKCYYAIVPKEHWSLPGWIDESRFLNGLEYLGAIGVGKGWLVSYHHMCRWNSGFFYKHPVLKDYDWYWRVEPNVHYFCRINYDVFRFMRDNNLKYGFNMNILDDARSFPSLWPRTKSFVKESPQLLHPNADLSWLIDTNTSSYNNCQFFSNFEIGSLNYWRSPQHQAYFDFLDKAGGFYYERWGDAPVHTLSVAMFVPKEEIWFFRDIGYQHDINIHCPPNSEQACECESTGLDANFYKLVPLQSPQRKPDETCIRQFLGGRWLKKREGWTVEGEKAFGGDGYHGYSVLGDE